MIVNAARAGPGGIGIHGDAWAVDGVQGAIGAETGLGKADYDVGMPVLVDIGNGERVVPYGKIL